MVGIERPGLMDYLVKRMGRFNGTGPEYQFWCPFCIDKRGDESSKKKLRFNADKLGCRCFRCDYRAGGLERLFRDLNGGVLRLEEISLLKGEMKPPKTQTVSEAILGILYASEEIEELKPYPLPPEARYFTPEKGIKLSMRAGYHYLTQERGIHERMIDLFDIRYCPLGEYAQRLIFPVWQGGEIVYWANRYCGKHPLKCKNPPNMEGHHSKDTCLLNYDNVIGAEIVAIVEGPLDCMAHRHAVSLNGKSMSHAHARLLEALVEFGTKEFVISLDQDAADAAETIYNTLLGRVPKVSILALDWGDPDERRQELPELMDSRGAPSAADRVRNRLHRR